MKQYKQLGNAADRLFSSLSQADMVTFVDYGSYRSKTPVLCPRSLTCYQ